MPWRLFLLAALGVALSYLGGLLFPSPPVCLDAAVAEISRDFERQIANAKPGLRVTSKGEMLRDRDTFFWSLFTDHFGSNPNTPYMWLALPAFGFFLPSPMWHMKRQDAVVLIARRPPNVEYFSFTSFALWVPRRGLQFSSLGDSVNNLNLKQTDNGIFAHVLTASRDTFNVVQQALMESGLPGSAINLKVVPHDVGDLFDDWTHFETVLRLFRFENQTEGDAYLHSHYPVFYLKGTGSDGKLFPTPSYQDRKHPDSKHERDLEVEFDLQNQKMLKEVGEHLERNLEDLKPVKFAPLMIQGLECLKQNTQCLGDCPDAAYYGPYIKEDSDVIDMLTLEEDDVHLVSVVNHRYWNVSVYGSLALLKSSKATLSKTRMNIRATPLGVTSFDFKEEPFAVWAFTRSGDLCEQLNGMTGVDGCTVVEAKTVAKDGFLTYCERIYLNPTTGTGPHWDDLLPARLFHLKLSTAPRGPARAPRVPTNLPAARSVKVFNGSVPMHFTHIVKTGGESLELHLAGHASPRLDYSACRSVALTGRPVDTSSMCATAAKAVSMALCGLNCECCAKDVQKIPGGFKGTLIRSPRAHSLSVFSQCHVAHHNSWQRIVEDLPQYLAEGILRGTERACGSYCTTFETDWEADLKGLVSQSLPRPEQVEVIPFLHNMQSHTLTCGERSLGQHFRLYEEPREPSLAEANASLQSFDWIGLTDIFEHSVCLLHYQASGALPPSCDCDAERFLTLPRFTHGVPRHDVAKLPQDLLQKIDLFTAADAHLFRTALRLVLGRLRHVEQVTGKSLLKCIRWRRLWQSTGYIPGLWTGPYQLAPS